MSHETVPVPPCFATAAAVPVVVTSASHALPRVNHGGDERLVTWNRAPNASQALVPSTSVRVEVCS